MNRKKHDYNVTRIQNGMKEYIFMTHSGYRHFFILGKDLKEAEKNFMCIDEIKRNNFNLDDLPIRLEYDRIKCKNWSIDKYWMNNENKKVNLDYY